VSIEGRLGKKLVVNAKKGFVSNFPVSLDFTVKDPAQWQSRIENASKARIESIEAERRKNRIQVVLDFSALEDYTVRGDLVLQTLKCPESGAPIKMSDAGNQTKCEHYGHTILAQDISDKIRSLI
jgi:hypothetical protein